MTADPLKEKIRKLEKETGYLSPLQTILLLTDGSVTTLLEAISGDEISVTTLSQIVSPATATIATALETEPGELVNHRVVVLKNSRTGEVLVYAVSYTPLLRLDPEFRDDLMRADIPIGKILKKHDIESRREIMNVSAGPGGQKLTEIFGRAAGGTFLSRRYKIIREGEPLMLIEEVFPASSFSGRQRVIIEAPSRLHIGLIDLNGGLGRVDGGIGIALDHPRTVIEACKAGRLTITGGDLESNNRARNAAEAVLSYFKFPGMVQITIHTTPAGHVGLGSGTALSLSVARAVCELYGHSVSAREISHVVGRGGTSGIGTGAFETGGFILDGGHSFGKTGDKSDFCPSSFASRIRPAPVTSRHFFPDTWQILLLIPSLNDLVSGHLEADFFTESCPVPLGDVQAICHEVVMRMLPGIVEQDISLFGAAVNRIQDLGFKKLEIARAPLLVPVLIAGMRKAGAACSGMSSFGPAVFAITESGVRELEREAREILCDTPCRIICTKANNHGADVRWTNSSPFIDSV